MPHGFRGVTHQLFDGRFFAHVYSPAGMHKCDKTQLFAPLTFSWKRFLCLLLLLLNTDSHVRSKNGTPELLGTFATAEEAARAWCEGLPPLGDPSTFPDHHAAALNG